MCGINGYITSQKENNIQDKINLMNNLIIHRGPDDKGIFIDKNDSYDIALGMRRLSIIDLHTGHQPIYSHDKKIIIISNGEIYNYKKLKKDLIAKGTKFDTNSDTEVILQMYIKYGVNSFSKLDGMFAFSIYDKNLNKVFVVRDYFGEKPLYYFSNSNKFIWASELKSIVSAINEKPTISKQAMNLYFQLTYIPAPFSIYKNIYKLKSNHYISYDCSNMKIEIFKIKSNANYNNDYKDISFQDAKNETYSLIMDSVNSRSISDVPLGTFLSGGVDSSIISYCLAENSSKPIDTFSIGFDKKAYDETDKSKIVSQIINSNHHEFIVSSEDIKNDLNKIILNFDEPFADSSALPTFLVSKLTKNHVKVALTGDGGDEVFGGYNKYYMGKMNNYYTNFFPEKLHSSVRTFFNKAFPIRDDNRGLIFKINRLLDSINYDDDFYYNIISLGFQNDELGRIINEDNLYMNPIDYYKNKKVLTLNDFRNTDRVISLEGDMLVKLDRTSMLNSLECRSPFLNKKIWEFTNSINSKFLMNGWNKKYLLKESFKNFFPNNFLNKSKKGFGVPVGDWMRGSIKKELLSFIDRSFLIKQNIFSINYISKMVQDHTDGKHDNTFRIWTFFCFQKWYKEIYMKL